MILVIMEMTALPAKRKEFLQTVHALLQPIRKEKGCITCSACQDIEDENTFRLIEGWQTQQDLDRHLRSDQFTVLLGTKNFLSKAWETKFNVDRNYKRHPESVEGFTL
jgi:quinol monooxygenase YgiN